jgi:hypothetical protein
MAGAPIRKYNRAAGGVDFSNILSIFDLLRMTGYDSMAPNDYVSRTILFVALLSGL